MVVLLAEGAGRPLKSNSHVRQDKTSPITSPRHLSLSLSQQRGLLLSAKRITSLLVKSLSAKRITWPDHMSPG